MPGGVRYNSTRKPPAFQPQAQPGAAMSMNPRSNGQWIADLQAGGQDQELALEDLRGLITRGLPFALAKWLAPTDPGFNPLVEDVVQETMLKVLDNLASFEGRSQFTTWVHKIAVRAALSELRRKHWRDTSLETLINPPDGAAFASLDADPASGPAQRSEQRDMIERVGRILAGELTERQRQVMVAMQINGAPAQVVADRMGITRNALYKLMHDARLRLRERLHAEGLSPEDILASFAE
jgi:RNA polymerase sigma-70 factor, ECF subfamily